MLGLTSDAPPGVCSRCATELPPQALACPRCSALVHRARLTELADLAAAAADAGDAAAARAHWQEARDQIYIVATALESYTTNLEKARQDLQDSQN